MIASYLTLNFENKIEAKAFAFIRAGGAFRGLLVMSAMLQYIVHVHV